MDQRVAPAGVEVFWGELAPCDHLVQVYEDESVFMDTLERFVGEGLGQGEMVVVIATASHRTWLEARLRLAGRDMEAATRSGAYLALDAAGTLAQFMVGGWPDEQRFVDVVRDIIGDGRRAGRKVRAFGEMVALLWAQGHNGATVRLEHLWNDLCESENLALFCAYPRIGATRDLDESLVAVCAAHSKVCHA